MSKAKKRVLGMKALANALEFEHKWGKTKKGAQIIHDERLAASSYERRAELRAQQNRQRNK